MNNIFSIRLKQMRKKRKLTLRQLEELASKNKIKKTSAANISRYENNLVKPGLDEIIALSKALNVTSDYLLGLTDKEEN